MSDSFSFTLEDYRQEFFDYPALSRFLVSTFNERTVLFLGLSLGGIDDYLTGVLRTFSPTTAISHWGWTPLG
jgi:hypothetical protein